MACASAWENPCWEKRLGLGVMRKLQMVEQGASHRAQQSATRFYKLWNIHSAGTASNQTRYVTALRKGAMVHRPERTNDPQFRLPQGTKAMFDAGFFGWLIAI